MTPVGDLHEQEEEGEKMGLFSSGLFYSGCLLSMMKTSTTNWVIVVSLKHKQTPFKKA